VDVGAGDGVAVGGIVPHLSGHCPVTLDAASQRNAPLTTHAMQIESLRHHDVVSQRRCCRLQAYPVMIVAAVPVHEG
jgi:hypothetical protein